MINNNCPHIHVIKTNLPPKNITISLSKLGNHKYPNIRTRLLKDKELIIEYSDKPLIGYGKPKLVLANKMYGLFTFKYFLDRMKLMKIRHFTIFSTNDCLPLPFPQGGVVVTMINKTVEMVDYTHASENCTLPTR